MNKFYWFDNFLLTCNWRIWLIVGSISGIIFLLGYKSLIQPLQKSLNLTITSPLENSSLLAEKERYKEIYQNNLFLLRSLCRDINLSALYTAMNEIAEQQNTLIIHIKPVTALQIESYHVQPVEFVLIGSYGSFVNFLKKLVSLNYIYEIKKMELSMASNKVNHQLKMDLLIYFYSTKKIEKNCHE